MFCFSFFTSVFSLLPHLYPFFLLCWLPEFTDALLSISSFWIVAFWNLTFLVISQFLNYLALAQVFYTESRFSSPQQKGWFEFLCHHFLKTQLSLLKKKKIFTKFCVSPQCKIQTSLKSVVMGLGLTNRNHFIKCLYSGVVWICFGLISIILSTTRAYESEVSKAEELAGLRAWQFRSSPQEGSLSWTRL